METLSADFATDPRDGSQCFLIRTGSLNSGISQVEESDLQSVHV